jgi:O-antigen/teichoic acid export membrane protein
MSEIIDHSKDTKRIAKNTMMLYIQMFFSMLVSLYTSRVLLNALGVSDFGTYNVVGGLVAMFSLISSSLSGSVSRFITYELGKGGDNQNVRRIFSTSLLIHIGLALIVILAMETIGVWFLNAKMVIAPDRLKAANWVFQGSLVSFAFGTFRSVPYNATIIAHEKMGAFSYITILQVTTQFVECNFYCLCTLAFRSSYLLCVAYCWR